MTRPVTSQRFRQRKLSTKVALQVLRENDLDESPDTDQQNAAKVETGVEKHEETEHHLQAAISASHAAAVGGNVAQIYIPTPETAESAIPYAQLYQLRFAQPATYIRFSSTVEDCCGCSYNLVEEDDAFLRLFNEKLADPKQQRGGVTIQCSEDQFEEVMSFFEETAKAKQPYSSVGDPPPVLSWEEMQEAFDEDFDEPARTFARDIYEHWQARRQKNANAALQPALRLKVVDGAADADDNDPYVCFRRRELRVPRKTRGRDAQSAEKLRKLRRELEEARQLVALVRQRELAKREQLAVDRQLFEQRIAMRKVKRTLPAPYGDGDEELLVNQKPAKKRPIITVPSGPLPTSAKIPTPSRADGRAGTSESDLVLLSDLLAEKARDVDREIQVKKQQHTKWNENFVDDTRAPLDPWPEDAEFESRFRPATTEYLPTPPASASSEGPDEGAVAAVEQRTAAVVRFTSPQRDDFAASRPPPSFRLRTGRLGRLFLDRRGMSIRSPEDVDPRVAERFKYDRDDEEEEDVWTPYLVDPDDPASMRYRAAISGSHPAHTQTMAARRPTSDAVAAANGAQSSTAIPRG